MTMKQQAVDAIIKALNTGDEVVRCASAQALGLIGDKEAVPSLMDHAMDMDVDVAMDAIEALGLIGDQESLPLLIEGLNKADDPDLRINAADAIGRLGGEDAVDALIHALTMDIDTQDEDGWEFSWDINMKAVDGLGRIGDERAVEPMVIMLDDENAIDDEARISASICFCGEKGVQAIVKRLKEHENSRSRRRAAMALGGVDSDIARDALADALLDEDADVRLYAARSLAASNNGAYLVPLLMLLKDQDAEVRAEAVRLSAQLGGERATEKIRPLLNDEAPDVIKAACKVLGEMKDAESVEKLLSLITEGKYNVRIAAIEAIGVISDESAREPLLDALLGSNRNEFVRASIPAALLSMVNDDVLTAFRTAVGDDQQAVRGAAMMALKEINSPEAQEILLAALRGELLAEPEVVEAVEPEAADSDAVESESVESESVETEATAENSVDAGSEADEAEVLAASDDEATASPDESQEVASQEQEEEEWTGSTLDAIENDNTAALAFVENLNADFPVPDELQQYVTIADDNIKLSDERKRKGKRMAIAPHQDVRMFAARALVGCRSEVVTDALLSCLDENESQDLRREAIRSLGELGDPRAVDELLPLLSDADRNLRFESIHALGKLGSDSARDGILEHLIDEDQLIRLAAVEVMSGFSGDEVVDALCRHLNSEIQTGIKYACAKSLAGIGDKRAVTNVVEATFMDGGDQCVEVGRVLRNFEPDVATSDLVAVLHDENRTDNHRAAVDALREIYSTAA
ncbi:MAG: HEAT repeat domain-containing protein [Mariprofundaceae bacterium]